MTTAELIEETEKQEVKLEDASDTDSAGDDDEVPELEAQAQAQMAQAAGLPEELVSKAKQSRSEKKARKALSKLGKVYLILFTVCGFNKFGVIIMVLPISYCHHHWGSGLVHNNSNPCRNSKVLV